MKAVRLTLIFSAVAALAQFPGGPFPGGGRYPGGPYPGGGPYPNPGPTGGPVGGRRPQQAPDAGRRSNSKSAPVLTTTEGMLRRAASTQLVIEADDHRIVWYRPADRVTYQKDGKDADLKTFEPGDRLSVDSNEDDDGNFTAVAVRWLKSGTPADRAAAAETWDLPRLTTAPAARASSASAPARSRGDDERPVLRRKNEDPAPTATATAAPETQAGRPAAPSAPAAAPEEIADNRPTTVVRPPDAPRDQDDSGPPRLRRGAPAPSRPAASTPAVSTPAPAANSPTLTARSVEPARVPAEAPATPAPVANAPILPQEDPVIQKARDVAASFTGSLPNFFCQQITTRYQTENIKQGWRAVDTVTADVAYEDGRESYKNIKVGNKAVNRAMEDIEGTRSTGEFATELEDLMNPATGATFRRNGQDTIHGRPAVVFKFEVPRERSHWRIEAPSQLYYPAYRGSVWIERDTSRVLRIEQETRNMPLLFPFDTVETATDYDFVRLAAAEQFLLPVESEVLNCQRGSSACSRNKIEFRNYRKFGAESNITFGDAADGKPPQN